MMLILQGTMWPHGNQTQSYEVLHVALTNQSVPGAEVESYIAHVLARPKPGDGLVGYEADIEVPSHTFRDGLAPLLMSVLGAAHAKDPHEPFVVPAARPLSRVELVTADQFEALLRRGPK